MNESVAADTVGTRRIGVESWHANRRRSRSRFYVGMCGALLVIVLIGFTRTLYLRPFFDVPAIPALLFVHGIVLTAWFGGLFLQTAFVAAQRTDIHRRFGWVFGGVGFAALAVSVAVVLNYPSRRGALSQSRIAQVSQTFWADCAALLAFVVFLSAALALRRQPEKHKRLMVLSSVSIISPAMSRLPIWDVAPLAGVQSTMWSLGGILLLILALAAFDVVSRKRVHLITVFGGTFLYGLRLLSIFVVATSEFGRSAVRLIGG